MKFKEYINEQMDTGNFAKEVMRQLSNSFKKWGLVVRVTYNEYIGDEQHYKIEIEEDENKSPDQSLFVYLGDWFYKNRKIKGIRINDYAVTNKSFGNTFKVNFSVKLKEFGL